jgi:chorismate mutase
MKIEDLRNDIDRIDDTIIELLATRKAISQEIGKLKKKEGKSIVDDKREKEIIQRLKDKAKENDLDAQFVEEVYNIILSNSREAQK